MLNSETWQPDHREASRQLAVVAVVFVQVAGRFAAVPVVVDFDTILRVVLAGVVLRAFSTAWLALLSMNIIIPVPKERKIPTRKQM